MLSPRDIHIFFATKSRAVYFQRRLREIFQQFGKKVKVFVIHDGPKEEAEKTGYPTLLGKDLFGSNYQLFFNPENYGKLGYWKTVNKIFGLFQSSDRDFLLKIDDDCHLKPDFFFRLQQVWEDTKHLKPLGVQTFTSEFSRPNWTDIPTTQKKINGKLYYLAGWVDCKYLFPKNTCEYIGWKVPRPPSWREKYPNLGSGVGEQITKALRHETRRIIIPEESLTFHEGHSVSVMNPELRRKSPLHEYR